MKGETVPHSNSDNDVLNHLASRAHGMSGADVEYVVRQARRNARRASRSLSFADLEAVLDEFRPVLPDDVRWRLAVHDAGHVVLAVAFGLSFEGTAAFIGAEKESPLEADEFTGVVPTVDHCLHLAMVVLAGRAAEENYFGNSTAWSGGGSGSDLATATRLIYLLETSLGFSKTQPLLYRGTSEFTAALAADPSLAATVNQRLEFCYKGAVNLLLSFGEVVEHASRALMERGGLDGPNLEVLLREVRLMVEMNRRNSVTTGLDSLR